MAAVRNTPSLKQIQAYKPVLWAPRSYSKILSGQMSGVVDLIRVPSSGLQRKLFHTRDARVVF